MKDERAEYLSAISESEDRLLKAFELSSVAPTLDSTLTPDPPEPSVNASTTDKVQLEDYCSNIQEYIIRSAQPPDQVAPTVVCVVCWLSQPPMPCWRAVAK